jgi:hypothetical protein
MADRHRDAPIAVRPPREDRAWLIEYARRIGKPVHRIVVEAIADYRSRHQHDTNEGEK